MADSDQAADRFQLQLRWSLCLGVILGAVYLFSDQVSEHWGHGLGGSTTKIAPALGNSTGNSNRLPLPPSGYVKSTLAPSPAQVVSPTEPQQSGSDDAPAEQLPGGATPPDSDANEKDQESDNASSSAAPKEIDGTVDSLDIPTGFKPHPNMYSETYLPRGQPVDGNVRHDMANKWGSWTFVDVASSGRPQDDYYANYPSRDVPRSHFPPTAWQTDPEYLGKFLPESRKLVKRAMEAILTEYGHGPDREPSKSFEERAEMFRVQFSNDTSSAIYLQQDGQTRDAGGYMNQKGWNGLVRRILHAVMTQDTFRVVMGGHSAAAGHGNHFLQSYTLQIQRVLEPVFARLGVTMTAHNIGMGGLGTLQNVMAARDIYSDDIDVLVYDAGMTEIEVEVMDLFMRQGILSGLKVPFLWINQDVGRFFKADIYKYLGQECDADVGVFGTGMRGITHITAVEEANKMPWAAQFLSCDSAIIHECKEHEYMSTCWIDRDDATPITKQNEFVGGRAGWHPGNRFHQLQGRVFAFIILSAMDKAFEIWSESEGYALDDSEWHVNDYYNNIRSKLLSLNHTTPCQETDKFPTRVCNLPIRGRTEFTPRVNAYATSIRSILKGSNVHELVEPNIYDPPDVRIPELDAGDVDVVNILENGVEFLPLLGRKRRRQERLKHLQRIKTSQSSAAFVNPDITPGLGWGFASKSAPDNCDGSYDSFCGRAAEEPCLLSGHNDFRGGLRVDGLSGWLVMTLDQLQHGLVILKLEDWHWDPVQQTHGWTCENNDCPRKLRGSGENIATSSLPTVTSRRLKPTVPEYCPEFQFQFALDGKITTWNLQEWQKHEQHAQRVVQLWTLLDDPTFTDKPKDVELAIRIRGCGRTKIMQLTHVYWA